MEFYHYTSAENWAKIQKQGALTPGRRAMHYPSPIEKEQWEQHPARWGFHEPLPNSWLDFEKFSARLFFMHFITLTKTDIAVLKFTIDFDQDDIWCADYMAADHDLKTNNQDMLYARSMASLSSMTSAQRQDALKKCLLPELICFTPIKAERIHKVAQYPANVSEMRNYLRAHAPKPTK